MIAFVFPGQGAQEPGMLHALDDLPGGRALVGEASELLGRDLLAQDDAAAYAGTAATQRALFVAGVASARALIECGVAPTAVAGHSVGAYAAAVIAGSIDFARALEIVDARGIAMGAAFPDGYAMGAVGGLNEQHVTELARAIVATGQVVFAANVNARDQVAIAGTLCGVDALLAAARRAGARSAQRLNVNVPSHSPLMRSVTATLERELAQVDIRNARIPYAANGTGRLVRDARRIRVDLVSNAEYPVRWADATRALYESGIRTFIEMRPGTILTDLAANAFSDARAVALQSAGLASTIAAARLATSR